MKTARLEVYHVFGTRGTVAASVAYRGKVLKVAMGNAAPQALANAAKDWARGVGFTHFVVTYG